MNKKLVLKIFFASAIFYHPLALIAESNDSLLPVTTTDTTRSRVAKHYACNALLIGAACATAGICFGSLAFSYWIAPRSGLSDMFQH